MAEEQIIPKCKFCAREGTKLPMSVGEGIIRKVEWREFDICHKCSKRIVPAPMKDEHGKLLWKNLFRVQFLALVLIFSVIIMSYSYKHDIAKCEEVLNNPYTFCVKAGCRPNPVVSTASPQNQFKLDFNNSIGGE